MFDDMRLIKSFWDSQRKTSSSLESSTLLTLGCKYDYDGDQKYKSYDKTQGGLIAKSCLVCHGDRFFSYLTRGRSRDRFVEKGQ